MKHWQELGQILERVRSLLPARAGPAALAIVTRIEGSAYRRPGAKLLIEADGAALGGVSGGCLEEDVRAGRAAGDAQRPLARLLHYETGGRRHQGLGPGPRLQRRGGRRRPAGHGEAALGTWARVRALLRGDAPFALSWRRRRRARPGGSWRGSGPPGGQLGDGAAAERARRRGRRSRPALEPRMPRGRGSSSPRSCCRRPDAAGVRRRRRRAAAGGRGRGGRLPRDRGRPPRRLPDRRALSRRRARLLLLRPGDEPGGAAA